MLDTLFDIVNFFSIIFENLKNYSLILFLILVPISSIFLIFLIKPSNFLLVFFGFKTVFYNFFSKVHLKSGKYIAFWRNFVISTSISNSIGLFTLVSIYGEGVIFWYLIFSLILLPIDFCLNILLQIFKTKRRKIDYKKKSNYNFFIGGISYVYEIAKGRIDNIFFKKIYFILTMISVFLLLFVNITSVSIVPVIQLSSLSYDLFKINHILFLIIACVISYLVMFNFNIENRRLFYGIYSILFLLFIVSILAYVLLNLEQLLSFFSSSFKKAVGFNSNESIFKIGIFSLIIRYCFYPTSFGPGISSDFNIQVSSFHPVSQSISKVFVSFIGLLFSVLISFLLINREHFVDLGLLNNIDMFRTVSYFTMGFFPTIFAYFVFVMGYLFSINAHLKNIENIMPNFRYKKYEFFIKFLMLGLILLSSLSSIYLFTDILQNIVTLSITFTVFIIFTNIITIFILKNDINYALENFKNNIFDYKVIPYKYKYIWAEPAVSELQTDPVKKLEEYHRSMYNNLEKNNDN